MTLDKHLLTLALMGLPRAQSKSTLLTPKLTFTQQRKEKARQQRMKKKGR